MNKIITILSLTTKLGFLAYFISMWGKQTQIKDLLTLIFFLLLIAEYIIKSRLKNSASQTD